MSKIKMMWGHKNINKRAEPKANARDQIMLVMAPTRESLPPLVLGMVHVMGGIALHNKMYGLGSTSTPALIRPSYESDKILTALSAFFLSLSNFCFCTCIYTEPLTTMGFHSWNSHGYRNAWTLQPTNWGLPYPPTWPELRAFLGSECLYKV